ncbi:MAG: hypothetical protein U0T83_02300 [Bacteriovoracaceae bacterium]
MKLIVSILFLLSFSVLARNIEMKVSTDWKNNGKKIECSDSKMVKVGAEWVTTCQLKQYKLKITAFDQVDAYDSFIKEPLEWDQVYVKGQIIEVINGKEVVISSPRWVVEIGKEAALTTNDEVKKFSLNAKIVPVRYIQ